MTLTKIKINEMNPAHEKAQCSYMIEARNLSAAYGDRIIFQNINFEVRRGEVFIILGGSGCGKSTLLKHLIGLNEPVSGSVLINGHPISNVSENDKGLIRRNFGVLYQSGALFSSLSVGENIDLVLSESTELNAKQRREVILEKLALVGLEKFYDFMPNELSGGMKKRAGLARAMALNPPLLFFDEPSAGLDPISSAQLDKLILNLRDKLKTTMVIVTHELESIFAIGDRAIMLDKETHGIIAEGNPCLLRDFSTDPRVVAFLTRDGITQAAKLSPKNKESAL